MLNITEPTLLSTIQVTQSIAATTIRSHGLFLSASILSRRPESRGDMRGPSDLSGANFVRLAPLLRAFQQGFLQPRFEGLPKTTNLPTDLDYLLSQKGSTATSLLGSGLPREISRSSI
jgi:hypothetical protein